MPTLLDKPSDETLVLLKTIAKGLEETKGESWPIWQYVVLTMAAEGLDAYEVYRGSGHWRHSYRLVRFPQGDHGGVAPPNSEVRLTVAGMYHAGSPWTDNLARMFVRALNYAAEDQSQIRPHPTEMQTLRLESDVLARAAAARAALPPAPRLLGGIMNGELPSRSGLTAPEMSETWSWQLEGARLGPYIEVDSLEEYLTVLESEVGLRPEIADRVPLPPTAIPEAMDHLNLAWYRAKRTDLVVVKRAMMPAELTLPVQSVEEFQSRCTALTSLLNSFSTSVRKEDSPTGEHVPSIAGLEVALKDLLPAPAVALQAVGVLRKVIRVRAGQQHREQGRDVDAEKARNQLGLAVHSGDYGQEWEHLRHLVVDALRTIRGQLPV